MELSEEFVEKFSEIFFINDEGMSLGRL